VSINIQESKNVPLKAMKQACSVFLSFFLSFFGLDTSAKFVLHVSYIKINAKNKE
jgi:amino acid transporter